MRKPLRPLDVVINLFLFVITAVIWLAFAPRKIGGQASYVMVHGNSMEPGFIQGDLAIVTTAPDYAVGDVITYFNTQMNAHVIHRIISVKPGRYVLQGDNNSWIDTYEPAKDEVIGKLWIHIPKLGITFEWLRSPINMALIAGILGGVLMIGQNKQPNQHGKRKNKPSGESSAGWVEMALYGLGFLTLAFFSLSIFAFTRPASRPAPDIKYEQTGIYYYSATSPAGIFDTELIHSGEPIFTKLTCSVIIGFSYNITGPLQDVTGTQQLTAQIADAQSGWQRTIPLTPATTFSGTSFSTTAPIDLCQFQSLVKTVGQETGFQPNVYSLKIISKMAVAAKVGGQNLYDSFDSNLIFQFDNVHYYLLNNGEKDPLQSSKGGVFNNSATEANSVNFLGFEVNVIGLRTISIGGLSISLLFLLILGWYIYEVTRRSEEAAIRIKYGTMLMDVYDRSFENIASVIEVSSIEDLAKLAERQNAMILHMTRDHLHTYFVQSDGTTYRYVNGDTNGRQTNHVEKREIPQRIVQQSEDDQSWDDSPIQTIKNEPNFIPKKVVIAYDGPLPYDEQNEQNERDDLE